MSSLTPEERRYLFVQQGVGGVVFNFALNAAIAYLIFSPPEVPAWGAVSLGADTLATGFLLPFLTVMISTPLVLWERRNRPSATSSRARIVMALAQKSRVARGLSLGLVGLVLAGVATLALTALGPAVYPFRTAVLLKGVFAAALAAPFGPLVARLAMLDALAAERRGDP